MFKHHLTVSGEVFGIENRQLDIVFAEQIQQQLLALLAAAACEGRHYARGDQRRSRPAGPAGRRRVPPAIGKVGASLMDDHHLAVDDGFA